VGLAPATWLSGLARSRLPTLSSNHGWRAPSLPTSPTLSPRWLLASHFRAQVGPSSGRLPQAGLSSAQLPWWVYVAVLRALDRPGRRSIVAPADIVSAAAGRLNRPTISATLRRGRWGSIACTRGGQVLAEDRMTASRLRRSRWHGCRFDAVAVASSTPCVPELPREPTHQVRGRALVQSATSEAGFRS
jgi:hypothetical protein